MNRCIVVHPDGRMETVMWEQRAVARHLGGSVTFVGGIEELQIVFVALAFTPPSEEPINPFFVDHRERFFPCTPPMHGSMVMIASDDDGEPIDVDVERVHGLFQPPQTRREGSV